MSMLALFAALGASTSWAASSLLVHGPARRLGAFALTKVQLVTCAWLLIALVTALGYWTTVAWSLWLNFAVSSVIGVVAGNLALIACVRRGGPRRAQLLLSMNAPIAAVLGYWVLDEAMTPRMMFGGGIVLFGVAIAILYGGKGSEPQLDKIDGSLRWVILTGLCAAVCQALGMIAIKPALTAGTEPLAATALRTSGAAALLALIALWPSRVLEPVTQPKPADVFRTVVPGVLGYIVAVSLLLYALRSFEAGVVAVLSSAAPVMMLPMIWIFMKRRPSAQAWGGACMTVIGTAVLFTK